MEVIALQSGSNGNCIYVEAGGVRLLFDAGISGKQAQARLAAHGRDIEDVHSLLISWTNSYEEYETASAKLVARKRT